MPRQPEACTRRSRGQRSALRGACRPGAGGARLALALLHGFGANAFSWSYVDRQLAARLRAQVTAHDMPGFGLTQRCALQGMQPWL